MAGQLLCLSRLAAIASSNGEKHPVHRIKSECRYYHYLCDEYNDKGWGCGYRSLQSMCSWVVDHPKLSHKSFVVPKIHEIQSYLVEMGDKLSSFFQSKEWIGCFEASIVIDHLYGVPCKIVHVTSGRDVLDQLDMLVSHFDQVGSPVMIGGDVDGAAKTLIAISVNQEEPQKSQFLLADPHYHGKAEVDLVLRDNHVGWHSSQLFLNTSFYNFCLPQLPAT